MDARVRPRSVVSGRTAVPGDKSIGHRWVLFSSIAKGKSAIRGLPKALDVAASAAVFGALGRHEALATWAEATRAQDEGATWEEPRLRDSDEVRIAGEGLTRIAQLHAPADCANSGTTMRLAMGLLSGRGVQQVLIGDQSLSARPMERVAAPLRDLGAVVDTTDGFAPVTVKPGALKGKEIDLAVPSSQVKGAILLAGMQAAGSTTLTDVAGTRDHTERGLRALGADITIDAGRISVQASSLQAFDGRVPGDPSSAAFLLGSAAITGGSLHVDRVGLNASRIGFIDVLQQMGCDVTIQIEGDVVGEAWGSVRVGPGGALRAVDVTAAQAPGVIDEIPMLASLAAHADGVSRFAGVDELRHKESDRLQGLVDGLTGMGARARIEGNDLIVEGGEVAGGEADPLGDHRLAMAFVVCALGATEESLILDLDCAAVSFPGFGGLLRSLGGSVEPA